MGSALNFTKAMLASLPIPPAGKRTYYRDSKTRGLMFAITDKGTRSFIFYRKINGKPERVLIGRFDDLSIEQARNKAAELNSRVASGWDPRKEREQFQKEPTLGQLFDEFMERHGRVNIKYAWQYERQFKRYFCTSEYRGLNLRDRKAKDIARSEIARVFGNITGNGQPLTANRILALISSVYNWGVRAGIVDNNPAHGIRKNSERNHARDRFLKPEEMPYFFQAVAAHGSEAIRDYVLLSLLTGQRQANILAMEWSEVDFVSGLWRIPKSKTKTAREYIVPLTPEAMKILLERRAKAGLSPFVLPGPGSSGHIAEPKMGWDRILSRAHLYGVLDAIAQVESWDAETLRLTKLDAEYGLENKLLRYCAQAKSLNIDPERYRLADLRLHDLRRTLASWQATTGANLVAISKTLNHANVATTSIYARLQTDPVRQAIQVATDAMFAAAGMRQDAKIIGLPTRKIANK